MRLTRRKVILAAALALVAAGAGHVWDLHARAPLPRHLHGRVPAYWRTVFIGDADVRQAVRGLYVRERHDRAEATAQLDNLGPRAKSAVPWLLAMLADGEPPADYSQDDLMTPDDQPRRSPPTFDPTGLFGGPPAPEPPSLTERILEFLVGCEDAPEPRGPLGGDRSSTAASDALASIGPAVVPRLIEALSDPIPEVRLEAARALGNVSDTRGIEPLRRLAADAHEDVRVTAVRAIGAINDPRSTECLASIFADAAVEEDARLEAGRILYGLGGKARAPLLSALRSPDEKERRLATNVLAYQQTICWPERMFPATDEAEEDPPDPDLLEALAAASTDADETTAMQAVDALRQYRDPRITEALVAALRSPSATVRIHAAGGPDGLKGSLGLNQAHAAVGPLLDMMTGQGVEDVECRSAAECLACIGDAAAVPRLVAALKDPRPMVRARAAETLGRLHAATAADAIADLLADGVSYDNRYNVSVNPAMSVKFVAAKALADLGDDRGVGVMVRVLADSPANAPVFADLYNYMLKVAPSAVGPLLDLAREAGHRQAAEQSLAGLDDPRAADALLAAARDKTCPARAAVLTALGHIGDPRGLDFVASLADDADASVRLSALVAMARLGDRRALAPLADLLGTGSDEQMIEILDALLALGDPRAVDPIVALAEQRRAAAAAPVHQGSVTWFVEDEPLKALAIAVLRLGDPRGVRMLLDCYPNESANLSYNIVQIGGGYSYRYPSWVDSDTDDPLTFLGQAARQPLEEGLVGAGYWRATAVAGSLARLTGPRAVEPLRQAYASAADDLVRYAILDGMALIEHESATEFLCEAAVSGPSHGVRAYAVGLLAGRGGPAVVEALRRATRDPCFWVRLSAWEALEKLTREPRPAGVPRYGVIREIKPTFNS